MGHRTHVLTAESEHTVTYGVRPRRAPTERVDPDGPPLPQRRTRSP